VLGLAWLTNPLKFVLEIMVFHRWLGLVLEFRVMVSVSVSVRIIVRVSVRGLKSALELRDFYRGHMISVRV